MTEQYLPVLLLIIITALVTGLILLINSLLGPKAKHRTDYPSKITPFECGSDLLQENIPAYIIAKLCHVSASTTYKAYNEIKSTPRWMSLLQNKFFLALRPESDSEVPKDRVTTETGL